MHFVWLLIGVALGIGGFFAFFAVGRAKRGVTPRRRELFLAVRQSLDAAKTSCEEIDGLGAVAIAQRIAVLRALPLERVALTAEMATDFAVRVRQVWAYVPSEYRELDRALLVAELNARTIAMSFELEEDVDPSI